MENREIEEKQLNAEENYMTTPISVLSYIRALEEQNKHLLEEIDELKSKVSNWMDKYIEINEENKKLKSELKDKESNYQKIDSDYKELLKRYHNTRTSN